VTGEALESGFLSVAENHNDILMTIYWGIRRSSMSMLCMWK
jgi:hypothetical protein